MGFRRDFGVFLVYSGVLSCLGVEIGERRFKEELERVLSIYNSIEREREREKRWERRWGR